MYRDNSLMPKEAVRLAALGTAAARGPLRYADLAASVRHFTARIIGPSLDMMGTSIELLRLEGLLEAADGAGMSDNALLSITGAGRAELSTLLQANVRSPSSDPFNKLVIALKLRFLHLLPPDRRRDEVQALGGMFQTELARLEELRATAAEEPGYLADWLEHDIRQTQAARDWLGAMVERVG